MRYEEKIIRKAILWKDHPDMIIYGGCDASGLGADCFCEMFYFDLWNVLWEDGLINKEAFNEADYNFKINYLKKSGKTQEEAEEAIEAGECDNMSIEDDWNEEEYERAIQDYQNNYYCEILTVEEAFKKYDIQKRLEDEE